MGRIRGKPAAASAPRDRAARTNAAVEQIAERSAAAARRAERDAQYRDALGLAMGQALPARLGTVGGSRGGHGSRISQATKGGPAPWHIEARRAAARRALQAGDENE